MIKKISLTNVKNSGSSNYELGTRNLLIGPNGSGKSALCEAISLIVEGKTISRGDRMSDIIELSPVDSLSVRAIVEKDNSVIDINKKYYTKKDKSTQEIEINSAKKKTSEATRQIEEWFGNFILRVDMKKMLDMNSKELAKFLFDLLGNKLGSITPKEVSEAIFHKLLEETPEYQGLFRFDPKYRDKKIEDLSASEKKELYDRTLEEIKNGQDEDVYDNYIMAKTRIDEVNQKQELRDYISSLVENLRKNVNDVDANRHAAEKAMQKLSLETNIISIDESKAKKDELKEKLRELNERIKERDKIISDNNLIIANINGLKGNIRELDKDLPDNLKKDINVLQKELDDINKTLDENVVVDINISKKELTDIIEKINSNEVAHNNKDAIAQYKEDIAILEKKIKTLKVDKIKSEIEATEKKLNDIIEKISDSKLKIANLKNSYEGIEKKIFALEQGICPTCGTKAENFDFTLSDLNKTKSSYLEELETLNKFIISAETSKSDIINKIKNLKTTLETEIGLKDGYSTQISILSNKIAELGKIPKLLSDKDLEELYALRDDISKSIAEYEKFEVIKERKKSIVAKIENLEQKIRENQEIAANNGELLKKISKLEKEVASNKVPVLDEDIDEQSRNIEKEITELEAAIEQDASERGKLETVEKWQDEIIMLTDRWKFAKKVLETAIEHKDNLVETMLRSSIDKAQGLIGTALNGNVILTSEICGLQHGNVLKPLNKLSGGEVVVFLSAVLAALMIESNISEKIIIIEGGELDDQNLIHVMSMFEKVDELDNVILTYPHNKVFDSNWEEIDLSQYKWNIIKMGERS